MLLDVYLYCCPLFRWMSVDLCIFGDWQLILLHASFWYYPSVWLSITRLMLAIVSWLLEEHEMVSIEVPAILFISSNDEFVLKQVYTKRVSSHRLSCLYLLYILERLNIIIFKIIALSRLSFCFFPNKVYPLFFTQFW